jgi:hypothetical protein
VFNAYGERVFNMMQASGSTGADEMIAYTGPLDPGMFYQFRVTTLATGGTLLQRTEDLRGVFFVP